MGKNIKSDDLQRWERYQVRRQAGDPDHSSPSEAEDSAVVIDFAEADALTESERANLSAFELEKGNCHMYIFESSIVEVVSMRVVEQYDIALIGRL